MNELSLFNSLFNNVFDDTMPDFSVSCAPAVPKVDVKENDTAYSLEMDLPGRSEKDVSIELDHNVLTISSVKEETKEEKKEEKAADHGKFKWLIRERRANQFSRRFTLPDDVDSENVKATFKNGVLLLNMPRKTLPAPKKIAISIA